VSGYIHFRNDGKVSGWSVSLGSLMGGIALLILCPLILSTIFSGTALIVGTLALVGFALMIHVHWKSQQPAQDRADAERAVQQARDWIRVHHGREPRNEDEVLLVARNKFW